MFVKEWESKFPKQYLNVIARKCDNTNCGNYKQIGKEKCIACEYGKTEKMTDKELAVVRKVMNVRLDEDDDAWLKSFDKENNIK